MKVKIVTLLSLICIQYNASFAQDQTQDLNLNNDKFIYFRNVNGSIDGARLGRHTGNSVRLRYLGNSFVFDALDNKPVIIRNSSDETKIQFHPTGSSFFNAGNLGLGKTSPEEKLDIANGNIKVENDYGLIFENNSGTNDGTIIRRRTGNALALAYAGNFLRFDALDNDPVVFKNSSDEIKIQLHPAGDSWFNSGNVGIGTNNPDSKLSVNGTIHTKEVKVDLNGWSDFVFETTYDLKTLEEVEQHINEEGHLPEIPSAAEVAKEGINLGEMDAKLLQKIEELTLYLIEQNKEIKQLKELTILQQTEIVLLKNSYGNH